VLCVLVALLAVAAVGRNECSLADVDVRKDPRLPIRYTLMWRLVASLLVVSLWDCMGKLSQRLQKTSGHSALERKVQERKASLFTTRAAASIVL